MGDPTGNNAGVALRILVVQGDNSAVETLAQGLRRNGYIVDQAGAGSQALIALFGQSTELGQTLESRETPDILYGELKIDFGKREVHVGDRLIDLTATEFDLLSLLARQPETVFSRKEIMESVWHADIANYSRTIDTHVYNLRRKLDSSRWIITVRGIGFRLGRGLLILANKLFRD